MSQAKTIFSISHPFPHSLPRMLHIYRSNGYPTCYNYFLYSDEIKTVTNKKIFEFVSQRYLPARVQTCSEITLKNKGTIYVNGVPE